MKNFKNIMSTILFMLIIMLLRIAADEIITSGDFSGDIPDLITPTHEPSSLECHDGDRSILLIVSGNRDVTSSDIETLETILIEESNDHCRSSSESFCGLSLGLDFSIIEDIHVDVCVSDVLSKRKRQSTITTMIEVDITDPDDLGQSIDGSDLLTIVDAVSVDFESSTGLTVDDIRLIDEEDKKSYLLIIIGSVVGGVIVIVAILAIIVIVLVVILVAKKSGKKNRVKPDGVSRHHRRSRDSNSSTASLLSKGPPVQDPKTVSSIRIA